MVGTLRGRLTMTKKARIALGTAGGVGFVLVTLAVLPLLFVGTVEERMRAEVERAARVRVDWSDVGLDLFGAFPDARLTLRGLSVVGTGSFDGDTLVSVGDFRLALGLGSVLRAARGRGPLEVRSVRVERPVVRLRVDEDGVASWNVVPKGDDDEAEGSGSALAVALRSLEVSDGALLFDDASSGLFLSVTGLSHSLAGDFSRQSLVAATRTHADSVTLRFAGIPYLTGVTVDFEGDFDVDMAEGQARLVENELRLNELGVRFEGVLGRAAERATVDLTFAAPNTDFGEVLSLVPAVYAHDFASLETSGTFSFEGRARGPIGAGVVPTFDVRMSVDDGRFRYPDLPLAAEAISARLALTNPGGDLDATVVEIADLHFEIGDQPVDASLTLRTPVSDPDVDARVRGTVDLADVARTVKLDTAEELGGVVTADAQLRARRSDVDNARYDRIAAGGVLQARDVTLRGEGLRQPVDIREAEVRLTPETAELRALDAQLGSSDVRATGRLDNLLGYAIGGQALRGAADFTSRRLVLDEWRSEEAAQAIAVPPRLDLVLDGTVDELVVNGIETRRAQGRATVRDERVTLEGFRLETLGGRVAMDGFYETVDPEAPAFELDLDLDSLDVAGAAEAFLTVRALAPIARYARGTFSTDLALSGVLGRDLSPVIDVLDGDGLLTTSRVVIEGFPLTEQLGQRLGIPDLANPVVQALRSSVRIQDGRLTVDPFDVAVGGLPMTVSGSNGFDQSVDYALTVLVPRSGLADDALTRLTSNLGPLGSGFASLETIPLSVRVTGTVTQPSLDIGLSDASATLREAATRSASAPVEERVDDVREQVDSTRQEARRRAQAEADSIVAEARRQADAVRAEAAQAAARIRAEGDRAAEELLSRAANPLARVAAEPAAERIRNEADERAADIEREADARATAIVSEAEARAGALLGAAGVG
jgi:hypothetical protein